MGVFTPSWLASREPYDHAARSEALLGQLTSRASLGARPTVMDLGCGTGSNARWLGARLRGGQHWVLVDHDPRLLELAVATAGVSAEARRLDLMHDLPSLEGIDLVTTQALLDLVSWTWLDRFAAWLDAARVPLLAALTTDGRLSFDPVHPDDGRVHGWFRAHQHTDRGWGASPGSEAAQELAARLEGLGWSVHVARADWVIPGPGSGRPGPEGVTPEHARRMLTDMIDGLVEAASEMSPEPAIVRNWARRRRSLLARSTLVVGHLDLLALPPGHPPGRPQP